MAAMALPDVLAEVDRLVTRGDLGAAAALLEQALDSGLGNAEHWLQLAGLRRALRQPRKALDAVHGKLRGLVEICEELGVRTRAAKVGPVWVVPLWSWYHASWDREPDVPGSTAIEKVRTYLGQCVA